MFTIGDNPQITTDFNLLAFDLEGNYLSTSSLTTNNYATNVPFEFGATKPKTGQTQVQYVIARSSVPTAPNPASHIRWIIRGNGLSGIGPAEYFTVNTPNTKGHAMANGCNGTAAYSVFRMSIPEYFTSPGPATVYFDNDGQSPRQPRKCVSNPALRRLTTPILPSSEVMTWATWIQSLTSPAPVRPLRMPRPSPLSSSKEMAGRAV